MLGNVFEVVQSFVVDAMTPETETTSWYFWGAARKGGPGDQRVGAERTRNIQRKVFREDVEVLEAQQRSILANPDLRLQAFNVDSGGVRSRLLLERLIRQQRETMAVAEATE